MYKLSFVMPCYNAQAYLAESVSSILNQSVKNIELIIVNDCSTDGSKDILKYYAEKDDRVKIITLKVNGGMSNARNVGNKKARSKIIAVQDADDVSSPDRASTIIKFFEAHKDVDMFYSAYTAIDQHDNFLNNYGAEEFDIENVFKYGYTMTGHPTLAYKKKVILEHPYENGEYSRLGFEDFRLVTGLWKNGKKFGHLNKSLVLYRVHGLSSTQTRDTEAVGVIKNKYINTYLRESKNECAENSISTDQRASG